MQHAFFRRAAVLACAFALAPIAQAQTADFPSKPLRIIVPAGPGGAADQLARAVGERMAHGMKTTYTVENKGGAGGLIGSDVVAKAPADGHTLLVTSNTLVISPALLKMPYDTQKDLTAVGLIAAAPNVLAVTPEAGVKNLAELLALAKRKPGEVTFGSPAIGSAAHLTVEMLARSAGVRMTHVPFKGPQQAVMETLAGRVTLTIAGVANVLPHINSGKLIPLAVTGSRRSPLVPNLPTFAELGVKDVDVTLWFGMFAPAGTPAPVLRKLNEQLNAALKSPEAVSQLALQGFELTPGTSAELNQIVVREMPAFAKVIQEVGIKAE